MEEVEKEVQTLKKKTVQNFYSNFVSELKISNPAKWYTLAKRLGAEDNQN